MAKYPFPAVILAGGQSRRMGQDKALLPFGDANTLAEYQYQKLSSLFSHVYLSTKSDKFDFDVPLVKDNYPESSPMVALLSIFETLQCETVFLLSVDTPFVTPDVISQLVAAFRTENEILLAETSNGVEPLCGLYRATTLPTIHRLYQADTHKLKALLQYHSLQTVMFEDKDLFRNLNYPEEYQKAITEKTLQKLPPMSVKKLKL